MLTKGQLDFSKGYDDAEFSFIVVCIGHSAAMKSLIPARFTLRDGRPASKTIRSDKNEP